MGDDHATLKRLEFVKSYGSYVHSAAEVAEKLYKATRSLTPTVAEPYVVGVEDRVTAYAAPVVTAVQDQADKALRSIDNQLDTTVGKLWTSYEEGRTFVTKKAYFIQSTHSKVHDTAKEAYLKAVEQGLSVVNKQRTVLSTAAQTATDAVQTAVEAARSTTEKNTELALNTVVDTWNYLLSFPAVNKIIETSSPALQLAMKYYVAAHDLVVANPNYKVAYDFSTAFIDKLQQSSMYKKGQGIVYPVISPVADPVLKRVAASPYFATVVDQLKPVEKVA